MQHKNLTIIGTSHIAKQSLDEVTGKIESLKPDIIALELDKKRFSALLSESKRMPTFHDIMRIGIAGYLFSLIGAWAEKKLGKEVGVLPGVEMKRAIELAKKYRLAIVLIDEDIEAILRKISSSLTWREKLNFIGDIAKAVFKKTSIEFDLAKVPEKEIIKKLIKDVKKRYPNLYRVLITDRNKLMAKRLKGLMEKNHDKNILAIVGAGHVEGIMGLIKKAAIRL